MAWIDVVRKRGQRDRCADCDIPATLPLLDRGQSDVLKRWLKEDALRRSYDVLVKAAAPESLECAERLCDNLLTHGWIVRHEKHIRGTWRWEALTWRDLPRLQALLGVVSAAQRTQARQVQFAEAQAWLRQRAATADSVALDPDLLEELTHALAQLQTEITLRADVLAARLHLWRAIAGWHDEDQQGTRREFALYARDRTKAVTDAEWRWLETSFDLERLRINRFAEVGWLAGAVELRWGARSLPCDALHFCGVPLADLLRIDAVSAPQRWWLIENRASFERQAQQRDAGVAVVWMPGRPSHVWLQTMVHLLQKAPAPAWISADADPSGVDIACRVGSLWQAAGLAWTPWRMGLAELQATPQQWPLNAHDRRLLAVLLTQTDLPPALRALCETMQQEGRKAEQEAWI